MYCYNVGCSKKFDPNENSENSCVYHLKPPVFHDGKKGWDCCKKFSTDFSTCLNTKGCQVGYHNPNKPAEPEKPKIDPKYDTPVVVVNPVIETPQRMYGDGEMCELPSEVTPNLELDIAKRKEEILKEKANIDTNGNAVPIGTNCKNNGCKRTYSNPDVNNEICTYHNGEAIFHEGLKFWTCCQRKTTEWESFMAQEGCTSGQHLWFKVIKSDCRYDWFQAGPKVTLSFYAKLALPETIKVKANSLTLSVSFQFECGSSKFEKEFDLFEQIDPQNSSVKASSAKIEIFLKKKRSFNWSSLEFSKTHKK